jgi:hypothetical protein
MLGTLALWAHLTLAGGMPPDHTRASTEPPPTAPTGYQLQETPDDLGDAFSDQELDILELLNRVDRERMPRQDHLVIPDRFADDPLDHSPFPQRVEALADEPKALLVHQPVQAWAAYEDGELVRWGPVSTGREAHPTPSDRFFLTWRSEGRTSTVNPDWYLEWYFNFHNERGLSFHQYEMPGRPASHACVRLLERDARWLYDWGQGWTLDEGEREVLEEGTPLWIMGEYDFDAPPPWLDEDTPHPSISTSEIEKWVEGEGPGVDLGDAGR